MDSSASTPVVDTLESRSHLSLTPFDSHIVPVQTHRAVRHAPVQHTVLARPSATRNFLVSFYGYGGPSWSNGVLSEIAAASGSETGSITRQYAETEGDAALQDFFGSLDANGDHILTTNEIAGVHVRAMGFSFGGIQAANFTRALDDTREPVVGYQLTRPIPVDDLVTIDPVNTTPAKHTDGVLGNVRRFTNFYQFNTGPSAIQLSSVATGASTGTASYGAASNVNGGPLTSAAAVTRQVRVDTAWGNRTITHLYDAADNGTLSGSGVDHLTMPWYVYDDVVAAIR